MHVCIRPHCWNPTNSDVLPPSLFYCCTLICRSCYMEVNTVWICWDSHMCLYRPVVLSLPSDVNGPVPAPPLPSYSLPIPTTVPFSATCSPRTWPHCSMYQKITATDTSALKNLKKRYECWQWLPWMDWRSLMRSRLKSRHISDWEGLQK